MSLPGMPKQPRRSRVVELVANLTLNQGKIFCRALPIVCLIGNACVWGQLPSIDRIDQSGGGQVGTEFKVDILGLNLGSIDDILFFGPGIEKRSIRFTADEGIELTLFANSDCRLGEHPFVLCGKQGTAEVRTLQIGPFPIVQEIEENSNQSESQPVTCPVTITGVVEEGDEDWFRVTLKKGERLTADVVALPLGRYLFDALLEVFDDDGNLLAKVDDNPLTRQDPTLSMLAPRDGVYCVRIREAAFGGDLDSNYRIHFGDFPRPTIAFPAGVPIGTETEITLLGDAKGPIVRRVNPDDLGNGLAGQTVTFNVSEDHEVPCFIKLRTSDMPNVLEHEPNNDPATANVSEYGWRCSLNGVLEEPGDVDCFAFDAEAGDALEITAFAARVGSPIDSVMTIYDPDGNQLTRNDDGIVHDSLLRFVAPQSGRYTLKVQDHLGRGGSDAVYRIEFEAIQPKLDLRIPTTEGSIPRQMQSVVVPRGANVPLLVSCRRQNFSEDVFLKVDGLPAGVSFANQPIAADGYLGVALFTADQATPTGAHLIQLRGEASVDARQVYGVLSQQVGLVFGEPRKSVYHSVTLDWMPLIVTDEAPIRFQILPPTSPLVQRGRLDLALRIDREPGFTGDVEVELAYAPPWLRGPEKPLRIDADTTSANFSLFAEPSAEIRNWSLVLVARTDTRDGRLVIATDPFEVQVAEPYLQLAVNKTIVQQGGSADVVCKLDWNRTSAGTAIAELRGLPKGATAASQTLQVGQQSIAFDVRTSQETPAAVHNTLFVELSVPESSETVTHYLGKGGVLEVLKPGTQPQEESSRLEILRRKKQ